MMQRDIWYWIDLGFVLLICATGAVQGLRAIRRQDAINRAIEERNPRRQPDKGGE